MLKDAQLDNKDSSKHASNAFLLAIISFCQQIGAVGLLNLIDVPIKEVTHTVQNKIVTLLLSYMIGCRTSHQIDSRLRPELLAAESLGIVSFPDDSTISRFLDRINSYAVIDLEDVTQALLETHGLACNLEGIILVDFDSTGLVVSGEHFEFAKSGYFANNRGAKGYQLSLATATNAGQEVLVQILDPGNVNAAVRFWDLLHGVGNSLGFLDERVFIRADRAYGVGHYIQYLLDLEVGFQVEGKDSRTAKRWISEIESQIDWISVDKSCWVADIGPRYMPKCHKKVRIILIRTQNKKGEYKYSYLATTLPWSQCSEVDVFHFYNKRVTLEKLIERSKNVVHITHIPTHHFEGLKFVLQLRFLAYNLLVWYQHYVLSDDERLRAMTVFELISTVAEKSVVVEKEANGWTFFLRNTPPIVQNLLTLSQLWLRKMAKQAWCGLASMSQLTYDWQQLIYDVWSAGHDEEKIERMLYGGSSP